MGELQGFEGKRLLNLSTFKIFEGFESLYDGFIPAQV